jgi:hypothetical protein
MRRAIAGLTIAAGLGALLGLGGADLGVATKAWAQDGAKSSARNLPPLVREEGAPPPTVELKDLPLEPGAVRARAPGKQRLQGAVGGDPSPAMSGDAGVAATTSGRAFEEKARRP